MKKSAFFLLWLCLIAPAYGQTTFNRQLNLDFPFKVLTSVLPTDSCYYATGIVTDTTGGTYKIGNIFVKFNLEGEAEYLKLLAAPGKFYETWFGDLIKTGDGGFVDIGLAKDSTVKGLILKYNSVGDTLFTREFFNPYYPNTSFLFTADIKISPEGNFLVLSGINAILAGAHNGDIYLLKFDSLGNLLQTFTYGGTQTEIPMSMLLETDGGVIIGAKKSNTGQVSQNFVSRTYIFKTDSLGEVQWEYLTPQGQLFDMARDMVRAPDGGLIIATGKGIEHPVNSSSSQLLWFPYFFKLNAANEFEWGKEFRGTRQSYGFSVKKAVPAMDGSGYVGISQIGEDVSIGEEVLGSWIIKVSPQGDSLWARYYSVFDDIQSQPHPYDLKNTPDGGYVVVGQTHPQLPTGEIQRAWMLKVDEHGCLIPGCHLLNDAEELESGQAELAIYPNPTRDFLNFQLRGAVPWLGGQFRIVDMTGKIVKTFQAGNLADTYMVSVWGWPEGVYFLQYLEEGKVICSGKVIVKQTSKK
ncbi:MAG: T9SS type A sorting domain-containing protein [Phaeodactylibacter sp.]|nr:T9SS type A sorting domain-containing protein [Phaeodactylibacter sp.]